ncbi:DUF2986 domain-containing protein [Vibrio breoganii]|uniref:DUF2986 domain-containing protein n=1 Tax=Vibrio breoganii TaxID=553239 RepID=A0AAN1CTI8_9VIBR|nr:DUF2986 domain-containing protein [Vibrio breoganii]ANO34701.1 DUF2986 domain-containing protein [Vibrio breoganii]OED83636.1 DUF2986 domain-containing protein [Vibrio breoganii ZF-55]OED97119.1 DUF2986 domain-containing protein [Vibrio breoganii ZF-29]PMG80878.1 DUF2986 domain-containing protein [Vibrio breoganii]PMK40505.1 DUF2986 domain-containing protein [Vibrio breoganii]
MNRKKKINQIFKKRMKKQNSKLHTSNKPKYISKAERAKMELEAEQTEMSVEQEPTDQASPAG